MRETSGGGSPKQHVLVVEDDPDTRQMLVAALCDEGYLAIPALDGQHALRSALATQPVAIVLDLMMPEADGAEFVRDYRRRSGDGATPPIVVVSARQDAAAVAARIGARACLAKPFEVGQLVERLAMVIRGGRTVTPATG